MELFSKESEMFKFTPMRKLKAGAVVTVLGSILTLFGVDVSPELNDLLTEWVRALIPIYGLVMLTVQYVTKNDEEDVDSMNLRKKK